MSRRSSAALQRALVERVGSGLVDAEVRRVDVRAGRRPRVRVDLVVRYGARIDDVLEVARVRTVYAVLDLAGPSVPEVEVRVVDIARSDAVVVTESR